MKYILFFLLFPLFASSQQIVSLDGSASTDADGTIDLYSWKQISGPANTVISNGNQKIASVSIPYVAGDYVFELTVTDNRSAISTSRKTVHVLVNPDRPPLILPALDQTVQGTQATLSCKATDPDGDKLTYLWAKLTGPNTPVITKPTDSTTTVTGLVQGVYTFTCVVIDAPGAIRRDTIQVSVTQANIPPVSNAGPDKTITLPASTVSIGLPDAQDIAFVQWSKVSGPNGGSIDSPNESVTNVSDLSEGVSEYEKFVRRLDGQAATDRVKITVSKKCTWFQKLFRINGCHF